MNCKNYILCLGKLCEESIGFCNQNPCQNKGICREHETSYACHCFPNFSGKNCEVKFLIII